MFILVRRARHFGKLCGCMKSGNQSCVEGEGAERGSVLSALREGTAGQVKVVRGTEKEDSFP